MWSPSNLGQQFLERYLQVFDQVRIICRVQPSGHPPVGLSQASGPRITFSPLGNFNGALGYVRSRRSIRAQMRRLLSDALGDSAFIIRTPAVIGNLAATFLSRRGVPYAVEVVGDPKDVFGWGRPAGPVGLALSTYLSNRLRAQVRGSIAVGYVPSPQLRQRYPPSKTAESQDYSSLVLNDSDVIPSPRRHLKMDSPLRIVTIGSMNWPYKGIDILIRACRELNESNVPVDLTVIGEGRLQPDYADLARTLDQSDKVHFLGQLAPGKAIHDQLDSADIFVLASSTEGLPRAMVEAMARGLPCVGTNVGGIPTLLPPELLAEPGDPTSVAEAVRRAIRSPIDMDTASARNLARAEAFRATEMLRRSRVVYEALARASLKPRN
jgi:phosphatidylinositol alpha-1,6-mannosyltransferase